VSEAKVRLGGAQLGELLVLDLDDLGGEIAIASVPERIDRQHLHVDRLPVHRLQPLVDLDEGFCRAPYRGKLDSSRVRAEQGAGLAEVAMGVNVDGLDLLAVDDDRQRAGCALGVRAFEQSAAAEDDPGRGGGGALQKGSSAGRTIGHGVVPPRTGQGCSGSATTLLRRRP